MNAAELRDILIPGLHDIVGKLPVTGLIFDLHVNGDTDDIVCHWRRGNWNGAFVAASAKEIETGRYKEEFGPRCRDELMRAVRLETVR